MSAIDDTRDTFHFINFKLPIVLSSRCDATEARSSRLSGATGPPSLVQPALDPSIPPPLAALVLGEIHDRRWPSYPPAVCAPPQTMHTRT